MLNTIFGSIFDTTGTASFALPQFLGCLFTALILGVIIASVYKKLEKTSASLALTLALLPAVVAIVIMVVNGNIGAGVAVAGAFSLVRFRSAPGSAKEISMIFLAMGCGLMCGMGYLTYAVIFTVILIAFLVVLTKTGFCGDRNTTEKVLRITIPESLNYSEVFDDIFEHFASSYKLQSVKTSNMGSMFKLTYSVTLISDAQEKAFIDALRVRNGNLEIAISQKEDVLNEL